METKLNRNGRCPYCGRFVKRGLWNFIEHRLSKCKANYFTKSESSELRKTIEYFYKTINKDGNQKTTNHRNPRMED